MFQFQFWVRLELQVCCNTLTTIDILFPCLFEGVFQFHRHVLESYLLDYFPLSDEKIDYLLFWCVMAKNNESSFALILVKKRDDETVVVRLDG